MEKYMCATFDIVSNLGYRQDGYLPIVSFVDWKHDCCPNKTMIVSERLISLTANIAQGVYFSGIKSFVSLMEQHCIDHANITFDNGLVEIYADKIVIKEKDLETYFKEYKEYVKKTINENENKWNDYYQANWERERELKLLKSLLEKYPDVVVSNGVS